MQRSMGQILHGSLGSTLQGTTGGSCIELLMIHWGGSCRAHWADIEEQIWLNLARDVREDPTVYIGTDLTRYQTWDKNGYVVQFSEIKNKSFYN